MMDELTRIESAISTIDKTITLITGLGFRGEEFEKSREIRVNNLMDERDRLLSKKQELTK